MVATCEGVYRVRDGARALLKDLECVNRESVK